jgi:hypothetical protein
MVIENKLRTAISVILACLRFTAIKIGIALMAITAKSSNVLIGGRPMAENSPSITPTGTFGESCRLSGQNPGAAISIERCSARKTGDFRNYTSKRPQPMTFRAVQTLLPSCQLFTHNAQISNVNSCNPGILFVGKIKVSG